jgi:iron complex transport system substrate-binding protein
VGALAVGRLVAAAAGAAVLALLGTACGERSEPTGATVRLYPVTVAGAGDRPFVAHRAARRIAVLAPGPRAIIQALGARRQIAGAPIRPNGEIRLRRLVQLRPDLIVASAETDDVALSRAAAATRATVYQAPDGSVLEVERAITQLGLLTGRPVEARRLVQRIEERKRLVRQKLAGAPAATVFLDTGLYTTVSDQSLAGDLIRQAGGSNVAGRSPSAGSFDLSELQGLDPDVYLATSESGTSLADLRRDARTKRLTAVQEGRFAIIPSSLLLPGPRIGDGLLRIARLLHPDAFR